MTTDHPYPDNMDMQSARARYFERNGFGETGGYDDPYVDFKMGPLSFRLPNTEARLRAVRYHDLHHVVTGYQTTPLGEFEISAWELGAGCRGFIAAWILNLGALAAGSITSPTRTWRAFVRGRYSRSLYDQEFAGLLAENVGQVRARTGLDLADHASATALDRLLFVCCLMVGFAIGMFLLVVGTVFALPLLVGKAVRSAFKRTESAPSSQGLTRSAK